MGNTRFNENQTPSEQSIIDSLYKIFEMTSNSSKPTADFEAIIKRKPSHTSKSSHKPDLKAELNNIIRCLQHFEHAHSHFDLNVKNTFNLLEKIILKINPLNFEEEIFEACNTIINKLAICFSKTHSLEHRKEWQEVILQHGKLIALIHNVVITRLAEMSRSLVERLAKNEKENVHINSKLVNLEENAKKQTRVINQVVSTIKALPTGRKK